MKLTVSNLGRIKEASLDIRPLTVFVGPNGTNKTWTAYALYALMRRLSWFWPVPREPVDTEGLEAVVRHITARLAAVGGEGATLSGLWFERSELEPLCSRLGRPERIEGEALAGVLGCSPESVSGARVTFVPNGRAAAGAVPQHLHLVGPPANPSVNYVGNGETFGFGMPPGASLEERLAQVAGRFLLSVARAVFPFPAERKAFLVFSLEEQTARSRWPLPLLDHARMQAMGFGFAGRLADSLKPALGRGGSELLRGDLIGLGPGVDGPAQLRLGTGAVLSMASSASLVRSFASLFAYARDGAAPGDFVVIDELEMNAHPRAQLALTEFVALLVRGGVRVLLTTHSPYVVDHVNNLIEASRAKEESRESLAQKFELKTSDAFLPPESVAVYRFEEGEEGGPVEVRSAIDADTGLVSGTTFGPVSNRVANLFEEALEAEHG